MEGFGVVVDVVVVVVVEERKGKLPMRFSSRATGFTNETVSSTSCVVVTISVVVDSEMISPSVVDSGSVSVIVVVASACSVVVSC